MKEEKGIFHGSKDGAGHVLKAKQVIGANKVIKLASTQRQRLICLATIVLKEEEYLVRCNFYKASTTVQTPEWHLSSG